MCPTFKVYPQDPRGQTPSARNYHTHPTRHIITSHIQTQPSPCQNPNNRKHLPPLINPPTTDPPPSLQCQASPNPPLHFEIDGLSSTQEYRHPLRQQHPNQAQLPPTPPVCQGQASAMSPAPPAAISMDGPSYLPTYPFPNSRGRQIEQQRVHFPECVPLPGSVNPSWLSIRLRKISWR